MKETEKKQAGNELDRLRQLHEKIYNNHYYLEELDEKIQTLTDGEEKDKLNQEYDKFHTLQGILIEEIDKLSRKVVKEIDYLKLPKVSKDGKPIGRPKAKSPFGTPKHQSKCKDALKMYEKLVANGMNETTAKNKIRRLKKFNWQSIEVCEKMLTNARNILKAKNLPKN